MFAGTLKSMTMSLRDIIKRWEPRIPIAWAMTTAQETLVAVLLCSDYSKDTESLGRLQMAGSGLGVTSSTQMPAKVARVTKIKLIKSFD